MTDEFGPSFACGSEPPQVFQSTTQGSRHKTILALKDLLEAHLDSLQRLYRSSLAKPVHSSSEGKCCKRVYSGPGLMNVCDDFARLF